MLTTAAPAPCCSSDKKACAGDVLCSQLQHQCPAVPLTRKPVQPPMRGQEDALGPQQVEISGHMFHKMMSTPAEWRPQ